MCIVRFVVSILVGLMFGRLSVVLCIILITSMAVERQRIFDVVKPPTGAELCSLDLPSDAVSTARGSQVSCGRTCLNRKCCAAYNYNKLTKTCEQYDSVPTNYTSIPHCISYVARGKLFSCLLTIGCPTMLISTMYQLQLISVL